MSITKCSTVLKKGVLCSTSDQMISLDKEHVSSKNKYKQLECGKNTSPLLLADIGSNNSQLNLMDVLRARKTKNLHQTRIRAIQLKNSTQVAKHRPNKSTRGKRGLKISKTKQESLGRSNESAKLIGVFGGANVGKASFMQLLKQNQQIIASDEQANRVILEHSDSKVNLFFETSEMYLEKTTPIQEADACVVMFAVSDKASFQFAKHCIQNIRKSHREDLPIFLVANKSDLIRHRKVSPNDAIRVANFHTCQYFETSLIFNYNVPELLQDILNQVQKNKTKKCMRCLHRVAEAFQNRLKKFFM
ncbi:GTP-binding protein GEM-like [Saccostrea echinata]|uniref:GTP-binding protein GEM-like n=1 Tax=Saccostrea echinata TaxID=191078 RepID=UPI002A8070DA|nr:GTP-binding protein GEM-like [Saccostrea echinata]